MQRPTRVLIAKTGLDGHDRGAIVLAMGLRDEGMEVIYTGRRQTPEKIAQSCIQEDVDVLGLSLLSGGHNVYFPKVVELLRKKGVSRILVIGGGIIPEKDYPFLKEKGVEAIFGPNSKLKDIAEFIRKNVRHQEGQE